MKFLNDIISDLLSRNQDLSDLNIVLPGKRPIVFIRKILADRQYTGFLPNFFTIEELIAEISGLQQIRGTAMWLFAYHVYRDLHPAEDFGEFLKWFPTLLKDWDDILKFSDDDKAVLEFMFDEERIKIWAENLSDRDEVPRNRYLNFWRKMNGFLPVLKQKLLKNNLASAGLIHESAKRNLENFVAACGGNYIFCGFNAFTPTEEKLVRKLLQQGKAECFFQADDYYINDERQEAGKFLRAVKKWSEFNGRRSFKHQYREFGKKKTIKVYDVSGNVSQTKVLPSIFKDIKPENFSKTAVVLLDENLLPATLDSLFMVPSVNITMGFPLKNLRFSSAVRHIFYLQKQLQKRPSTYYYNDVLPILEELPAAGGVRKIIDNFKANIEKKNIVYLSSEVLTELLANLPYFEIFKQYESGTEFLETLVVLCQKLSAADLDDIEFENIAHFEKAFRVIKNQISPYGFNISAEILEVLINQIINSETIDFQGEPLEGLQVMGLLETRLLNFDNVILLSVNEGKLPLGNSQNTYLPTDVRSHFNLHTFQENDSIYAYHFYRLIQGANTVHLLYNALSSGVNTGEKSRFITQLEVESPHQIDQITIENNSEPITSELMTFTKTAPVMETLEDWKDKVSASHLTSYNYNPVEFYFNQILKTREGKEIEEELSVRNYGNLVHFALQFIYEKLEGKTLTSADLKEAAENINDGILHAVKTLKHEPEFYNKGMNFIHKSIAERVLKEIISYDLALVEAGNKLEIVKMEMAFSDAEFDIDENVSVRFRGIIDRVDRLNGHLRIIDYKTAKGKGLDINPKTEKLLDFLKNNDAKQALQLSIYAYSVLKLGEFPDNFVQCGIWSFAEVSRGVQPLSIYHEKELNPENLEVPMNSVKEIIAEILNPGIPFTECIRQVFT